MSESIIKIYGERNSGTNFIERLCKRNLIHCEVLSGNYNGGSGWKHGRPRLKLFDSQFLREVVFICVIRNLPDWLNSMYNRPYHILKRRTFTDFITKRTIPDDSRKKHDIHRFSWEKRKNLLQLRYYKYQKYKELFNKVPKVVLVNLDFVQKNKGADFINAISKRFGIKKKQNFVPIDNHTKTHNKEQNAKYRKFRIIDRAKKYINYSLESEINNLTVKY